MRFRDNADIAPACHFPAPFLVSPKFSYVPMVVGGWSLGCEERRCWDKCLCN